MSVSLSEIVALLIICIPIAVLTIWGARTSNKESDKSKHIPVD